MPKDDIKMIEKQFSNAQFMPEIVKLLNEGHTITLTLRGYSMRPFLEDRRDKGLLVKAEHPAVGMPVLAEVEGKRYVLHRIVKIEGDNVTLRGDGNLNVEHCKLSDVKGEAIGFYRKGRTTMDSTSGKKWIIYSALWTTLLPIRRYLLAILRRTMFRQKKQY